MFSRRTNQTTFVARAREHEVEQNRQLEKRIDHDFTPIFQLPILHICSQASFHQNQGKRPNQFVFFLLFP